jgi:hypothetical protein
MTPPPKALAWNDPYVVMTLARMQVLIRNALMGTTLRGIRADLEELAALLATFPPRCSFCRKTGDEVNKLISGPKLSDSTPQAFICNLCVGLCNEIKNAPI